jgi:hypothetical protein
MMESAKIQHPQSNLSLSNLKSLSRTALRPAITTSASNRNEKNLHLPTDDLVTKASSLANAEDLLLETLEILQMIYDKLIYG